MGIEFAILLEIYEWHRPWLDACMKALTSLGNGGWFWIVLGLLLLCFAKTRKAGFGILLSLFLGLLLGNLLLKNLVARERPCWLMPELPLLIAVPQDYSFPSGHTLASVEAALMLYLHHRRWGVLAGLLALGIAFSRLYLFVHFPTDVLAGALLALFNVWLVHRKLQPALAAFAEKRRSRT
ncbi:MAG: phosphatase PAP2 family protein [bacterium]|nr:phosphatase PAP2 family protein [bacterium]